MRDAVDDAAVRLLAAHLRAPPHPFRGVVAEAAHDVLVAVVRGGGGRAERLHRAAARSAASSARSARSRPRRRVPTASREARIAARLAAGAAASQASKPSTASVPPTGGNGASGIATASVKRGEDRRLAWGQDLHERLQQPRLLRGRERGDRRRGGVGVAVGHRPRGGGVGVAGRDERAEELEVAPGTAPGSSS